MRKLRQRGAVTACAVTGLMMLVCGCSWVRRQPAYQGAPLELIAIMPIERLATTSQPSTVEVELGARRIAAEAGQVVTAQIYGVMAESPRWRFVPDLTVETAIAALPSSGSLEQRALALGKAVAADGVIYGTVSRFKERSGTGFGSREPASASFRLALLEVDNGETVWTGEFDQTQQPLSSNLFGWWQFWRAGPRWFTVRDLTRLGVEELLDELEGFLG